MRAGAHAVIGSCRLGAGRSCFCRCLAPAPKPANSIRPKFSIPTSSTARRSCSVSASRCSRTAFPARRRAFRPISSKAISRRPTRPTPTLRKRLPAAAAGTRSASGRGARRGSAGRYRRGEAQAETQAEAETREHAGATGTCGGRPDAHQCRRQIRRWIGRTRAERRSRSERLADQLADAGAAGSNQLAVTDRRGAGAEDGAALATELAEPALDDAVSFASSPQPRLRRT